MYGGELTSLNQVRPALQATASEAVASFSIPSRMQLTVALHSVVLPAARPIKQLAYS